MTQVDSVAIRNVHPADHPAIADMMERAYGEFEPNMLPENWLKLKASVRNAPTVVPGAIPLVAEVDGVIRGFVSYVPPGHSDGILFPKEWASIRLLGVDPRVRGLKLGKRLTEECLRRAKADGANIMGLHTSQLMNIARGFYERLGFTIYKDLGTRLGIQYWSFKKSL